MITNDYGNYSFVNGKLLFKLIKDQIEETDSRYGELRDKKFVYSGPKQLYNENDISALRDMKSYLFSGTSLHIFVMTDVCNMNCVYCQAKSPMAENTAFMSEATGKRAVEIALQLPSRELVFEFQGGRTASQF